MKNRSQGNEDFETGKRHGGVIAVSFLPTFQGLDD